MKNLIITAAGLSTRFEGLKPKWMLTHPKGNWMIVEALKNFDFDNALLVIYTNNSVEPKGHWYNLLKKVKNVI